LTPPPLLERLTLPAAVKEYLIAGFKKIQKTSTKMFYRLSTIAFFSAFVLAVNSANMTATYKGTAGYDIPDSGVSGRWTDDTVIACGFRCLKSDCTMYSFVQNASSVPRGTCKLGNGQNVTTPLIGSTVYRVFVPAPPSGVPATSSGGIDSNVNLDNTLQPLEYNLLVFEYMACDRRNCNI
jgi:hypothetical protein